MTLTKTSYGQIEKLLSGAGIRFTRSIDISYTNSKEWRTIRHLEVYCNKIVQDVMLARLKELFADLDVEITNDNFSIYIKVK